MPYNFLTITQFAKREKISYNRVMDYIRSGRVSYWEAAEGIKLIPEEEKKPMPQKPWYKKRDERISRESF